jgi:hypothetical protein
VVLGACRTRIRASDSPVPPRLATADELAESLLGQTKAAGSGVLVGPVVGDVVGDGFMVLTVGVGVGPGTEPVL